MFRFADPDESRRLMEDAGFTDIETRVVPHEWRPAAPRNVLDMIYKSVVRMPMILEAQEQTARERIHAAILEGAEAYRRGGDIVLQFPALLVTGRRPG